MLKGLIAVGAGDGCVTCHAAFVAAAIHGAHLSMQQDDVGHSVNQRQITFVVTTEDGANVVVVFRSAGFNDVHEHGDET